MANEGSKKGGQSAAAGSATESSDNSQDNLKSFLVGLATDPARLGAFIRDPDSELTTAGIGDAEGAVLKSGNAAAIYGLLSGASAAPMIPPVTILVIDSQQKEGEEAQLSVRGQNQMLYPMVMPYAQAPAMMQQMVTSHPVFIPPMVIVEAVTNLQMVPHITMPQFPPPPQITYGQPSPWPQYPPQLVAGPHLIFTPQLQLTPLQLVPQMLQITPQITPQIFAPRIAGGQPAQAAQGGWFPQLQIHPQLVVQPQIHPQLVVQPQIHPQLVVQPQIHPQLVVQPQIHPQLVVQPQIHPQLVLQPQIHPQLVVQPQIHPQLVVHPQIHPQLLFRLGEAAQAGLAPQIQTPVAMYPPLVLSQLHPQIVVSPQIHPQIHPMVFPQIFPQIYPQFYAGYGQS